MIYIIIYVYIYISVYIHTYTTSSLMRSRLQLLLLKLVDLPLNPHPLAMGPPRQPRKYLAYLAKQRDRRRKVRLESARAKARRILKDEFAQERRTADAARRRATQHMVAAGAARARAQASSDASQF